MQAKLIINLEQGMLEVEGSDSLVKEIYFDFKDLLKANSGRSPCQNQELSNNLPQLLSEPIEQTKKIVKKTATKKVSNSIPSMIKDLDLKGDSETSSLRDFYNIYIAKTNFEINLVCVYYLQHKMNLENITTEHIFTCYREVGAKIPKALRQSIVDTGFKKKLANYIGHGRYKGFSRRNELSRA